MKKIIILILAVIIVSCSGDDDSSKDYSSEILGFYELTKMTEEDGTEIDVTDMCNWATNYEFTNDDKIIETHICEDETSFFTSGYELNDDKLKWIVYDEVAPGQDYVIEYDIITLNSEKLVIRSYNDSYGDDSKTTEVYKRLN
ncbi:hypothetical protein F3C99_10145 [Vitellibacter sp. q18]|jgi:hypothetical protein|nr:hypothetical protein [Aequorivita lutea]